MKSYTRYTLEVCAARGYNGYNLLRRPFIMTDNLYEQIAKIEREIARMPEGGIAKKTIKGKQSFFIMTKWLYVFIILGIGINCGCNKKNQTKVECYYFDIEKCKHCPYKEGCYKEGAKSKTYNVSNV